MSIKSAKKRKEQIKYDGMDIDYAFSLWVVPRLEWLKQNTISHPTELTMDEWKNILQDMIDGFYWYSINKYSGINDIKRERVELALSLFKKWFYNLWD